MCYFLICYSKGWYKVCCVYKHIVISFISNSDLLLTEVRATSKYQKGHSYRKDPLDHKGFTPTYCNLSVPKCSSYPSVPLPVFPLLFSPWLWGIFLKRDISVWFVKLEYLCKNCHTFSPFPTQFSQDSRFEASQDVSQDRVGRNSCLGTLAHAVCVQGAAVLFTDTDQLFKFGCFTNLLWDSISLSEKGIIISTYVIELKWD